MFDWLYAQLGKSLLREATARRLRLIEGDYANYPCRARKKFLFPIKHQQYTEHNQQQRPHFPETCLESRLHFG